MFSAAWFARSSPSQVGPIEQCTHCRQPGENSCSGRHRCWPAAPCAVPVAAGIPLYGGRDASLSAADVIAGKDPRLIVHSAAPAELETPLALLREHGITPDSLLFVRNNQSLTGRPIWRP